MGKSPPALGSIFLVRGDPCTSISASLLGLAHSAAEPWTSLKVWSTEKLVGSQTSDIFLVVEDSQEMPWITLHCISSESAGD